VARAGVERRRSERLVNFLFHYTRSGAIDSVWIDLDTDDDGSFVDLGKRERSHVLCGGGSRQVELSLIGYECEPDDELDDSQRITGWDYILLAGEGGECWWREWMGARELHDSDASSVCTIRTRCHTHDNGCFVELGKREWSHVLCG